MRKRKSAFLRVLEARRAAARQERGQGQHEETGEVKASEDAESSPLTRLLLPSRKTRRPWK
jgi:hypothetical protein